MGDIREGCYSGLTESQQVSQVRSEVWRHNGETTTENKCPDGAEKQWIIKKKRKKERNKVLEAEAFKATEITKLFGPAAATSRTDPAVSWSHQEGSCHFLSCFQKSVLWSVNWQCRLVRTKDTRPGPNPGFGRFDRNRVTVKDVVPYLKEHGVFAPPVPQLLLKHQDYVRIHLITKQFVSTPDKNLSQSGDFWSGSPDIPWRARVIQGLCCHSPLREPLNCFEHCIGENKSYTL